MIVYFIVIYFNLKNELDFLTFNFIHFSLDCLFMNFYIPDMILKKIYLFCKPNLFNPSKTFSPSNLK